MVVGGSRRMGLTARLARHEGTEVTIAGRPQERRIQARQELGQVPTAMMDVTDAGAVGKSIVGPAVSIMGAFRPGRFAMARWLQ
jgi:short-subunit dehydrogenase involved in D-alanine esterification of teichoic acids